MVCIPPIHENFLALFFSDTIAYHTLTLFHCREESSQCAHVHYCLYMMQTDLGK